jgi:hypothetical protein
MDMQQNLDLQKLRADLQDISHSLYKHAKTLMLFEHEMDSAEQAASRPISKTMSEGQWEWVLNDDEEACPRPTTPPPTMVISVERNGQINLRDKTYHEFCRQTELANCQEKYVFCATHTSFPKKLLVFPAQPGDPQTKIVESNSSWKIKMKNQPDLLKNLGNKRVEWYQAEWVLLEGRKGLAIDLQKSVRPPDNV